MQKVIATDEEAPTAVSPVRPPTAEEFAAMYAERVHRFAVAVAPAGHDPQDVAQEALLRALVALDRFDPRKGSMDAWLWRILANTARDAGRFNGRAQALVDRWRLTPERPAIGDSSEAVAMRNLGDRELLAAVRRLPPRYRLIIALRFGAGLTFPEIAAATGTSRMAAQLAMRRALDRLRLDPEVQKR
jgi:RNA polymerase sigma-70 factor (ECF subfamily)